MLQKIYFKKIATMFSQTILSVADFERQNDVRLPEDIAAMLTNQERISTLPVERSQYQPPCGIELPLFKDITARVPEQKTHPSTHHIAENSFHRQSKIEDRPTAS